MNIGAQEIRMETPDTLEALALRMAAESNRISAALRKHGHRQRRLRVLARVITAFVGVTVVALVAVPDLATLVGPEFIRAAAGVAAAVLIANTALPLFLDLESHELILAYSRHLNRYKGIIEETIANQKYSESVRHARLTETIRLMRENISDARTNWPRQTDG